MNEKLRILQINAGSRNFGGVSAMLFQIYANIDRDRFQFDFVSPNITTYEPKRKKIEEMGGRIFELRCNGNILKRKILLYFRLKNLIKKNKYKIVHINSGSFFFNLEVGYIAKKCKVEKIIIHSHNGLNPKKKLKNFLINVFKFLIQYVGTDFLSCSELASEAMYSKRLIKSGKIIIIPNGIDTNKFKFNEEIREKYRKNLKVSNNFVIGHIGRFVEQKNHKFLLEVFKEVLMQRKNAILMLIGDGQLKGNIEELAEKLKIKDKILFMGFRDDISNLMMAMDVFVLTSLHEGLPVVGVEAQTTGLPVILTDNVTKEVDVTGNIEFLSLDEGTKRWSEVILKKGSKKINRIKVNNLVTKNGFDIKGTTKLMEEVYMKE